jgi:hypothetical protein
MTTDKSDAAEAWRRHNLAMDHWKKLEMQALREGRLAEFNEQIRRQRPPIEERKENVTK